MVIEKFKLHGGVQIGRSCTPSSTPKCSDHSAIMSLSTRKSYGKVLIERLKDVTEGKVIEEQEGSRKRNLCIDQIFAIRMVVK